MKITPDNLKVIRTYLGITQGKLAHSVGVSSSFISAIERDERRLTATLERQIKEALGVSSQDIEEFIAAHAKLIKNADN